MVAGAPAMHDLFIRFIQKWWMARLLDESGAMNDGPYTGEYSRFRLFYFIIVGVMSCEL